MAVIAITGTPGTGKSTLAQKISAETGFFVLDVTSFIKDNGLSEGFDEKRDCEIVDTNKLSSAILKETVGRDVIIDSHLSHYLPPLSVDLVIVTTCDIQTLKKRLASRGYSAKKIRENIDSEILGICKNEALEAGHDVTFYDTTDNQPQEVITQLVRRIRSLKDLDTVDDTV